MISIAMVAVRLARDCTRLGSNAAAVGAYSGAAQRLRVVEAALIGADLRVAPGLV